MAMSIAYANRHASLAHGGQRIAIRAGEPWDAADPLVKAYPDFFDASLPAVRCTTDPSGIRLLDRQEDAAPETATAAPGERRTTRRPRTSGGGKQ
ncbi:hypothetical protein GCM10009550_79800 [Actinocorallia libanotica]|uniref:Uncharacterized protein n=2 Tax=Actinocorallia TaxID=58108 RepID=A0ABP6H9H4_9ACTN